MRFPDNMTAGEACKEIIEKHEVGGPDHGLYHPVSETSTFDGKWLKPSQTLSYYDLATGDYIEFRKKHQPISVAFLDGTKKKVLIDTSENPDKCMLTVGEKLSMKHIEEFAFKLAGNSGNNKSNWLNPTKSLLEQIPSLEAELLVVKKFTATEPSAEDPFTLHLVYVQAREDILSGTHPTSKEEALSLAALQTQSDRGDYEPSSKVDIKLILPKGHQKVKGADKAILSEWKTLAGTPKDQAKFRYINKCRTLKTWGITIFHVKQKDGKSASKLHSKIYGFTRDRIITMSSDGRAVEKTRPLVHLKRWAATGETLTLDFGSHDEEYTILITPDGEEMSSLIAGYIDILINKNKQQNRDDEDDEVPIAQTTNISNFSGISAFGQGMSALLPRGGTLSSHVTDLDSAVNAINKLVNNMLGDPDDLDNLQMTPEERKKQMEMATNTLQNLTQKLIENTSPINREALNGIAQQLAYGIEGLINGARNAQALGLDPDGNLFNATKGLAEALGGLISDVNTLAANPHDENAKLAVKNSAQLVSAALEKLQMANQGIVTDPNYEKLMNDLSNGVALAAQSLLTVASKANVAQHPEKKGLVTAAKGRFVIAKDHFGNIAETLAPVAQQARAQHHLKGATQVINDNAQFLSEALRRYGIDPGDDQNLSDAMKQLATALGTFLSCAELPLVSSAQGAAEFTTNTQTMIESANAITVSPNKPEIVKEQTAKVQTAHQKLQNVLGVISSAASDPRTAQRLTNHGNLVAKSVTGLLQVSPQAIQNPNDQNTQNLLRGAAQKVADSTQDLVADAGTAVALDSLYTAAKGAIGASGILVASAHAAKHHVRDPNASNALTTNANGTQDAIDNFIHTLKNSNFQTDPTGAHIMEASEKFAPVAFKLVAAAKSAVPKTTDESVKKDLTYNSDYVQKAVQKLLMCRKAARAGQGGNEIKEALNEMGNVDNKLKSLLKTLENAGALEKSDVGRDLALRNMQSAIKEVATATKEITFLIKEKPEELGASLKVLVSKLDTLNECAAVLCGTIPGDQSLQREILGGVRELNADITTMMGTARAAASDPKDVNITSALNENAKSVATALARLVQLTKRIEPEELLKKRTEMSKDIEDLAEKEMLGAAEAINGAVLKLKAYKEEATRKLQSSDDLDIDDANINVALLEGCQALASATSTLMISATNVQREFNAIRKNTGQQTNLYKRDSTWAEGLISAAKEVAATVGHLVQSADSTVKGTGEVEALIISAKAVASSTARLVTASTVKNVNQQSVARVQEASRQVNGATKELVNTASSMSEKKLEKEEGNTVGGNAKIREMEEQMEIERLEQELIKMRRDLLQKRKDEYANATGSVPSPSKPAVQPVGNGTLKQGKPAQQSSASLKPQGLKPAPNFKPQGKPQGKPMGLKPAFKPQGKPQGLKPAFGRN